eukprot:5462298-Prymnesium_polylepis.3
MCTAIRIICGADGNANLAQPPAWFPFPHPRRFPQSQLTSTARARTSADAPESRATPPKSQLAQPDARAWWGSVLMAPWRPDDLALGLIRYRHCCSLPSPMGPSCLRWRHHLAAAATWLASTFCVVLAA